LIIRLYAIFWQSRAAVASNTSRIRLTSRGKFCGFCRHMLTNSSFLLIYKPNSRCVPRVGRVLLAQAHTQAFQTPPSTLCFAFGQVGPRPSPKPIALAYLHPEILISTCVMWVSIRLFFRHITRACGVNFHYPSTHPQIKPCALNAASTLPNPLQQVPENTVIMWNTE
jgi:hypothetical protein